MENGARENVGTPICIAGMHRSGTSTIAQLLYRCGLYLGPESDLFAPKDENPDGYWENKNFVGLNEKILQAYRSGWDLPFSPTKGWHEDERLYPVKVEAEQILKVFEGRDAWGWKDPRNSLTLPFWMSLLPDMRVLVCVRNPLEVALSLRKRGNSSYAFGLNLCEVYYRRLYESLPTNRYVVTHYEAYFYRPKEELRRVLDALRFPASDQLVAFARSTTLKGLRHHRLTTQDLLDANASPELIQLYMRLCEEADWRLAMPETVEADTPARSPHIG